MTNSSNLDKAPGEQTIYTGIEIMSYVELLTWGDISFIFLIFYLGDKAPFEIHIYAVKVHKFVITSLNSCPFFL